MPYANLRGEMAKKGVLIEDIAALLGIHRNSVANKLKGSCAFTTDEAMKIQEKYFPDLELKYLFKRGA